MSRLQADLVLLFVALIWGAAFVAQKDALAHVGSLTFIAARFAISAVIAIPLAWREHGRVTADLSLRRVPLRDLALLCASFAGAVILQQVGLEKTTVTNAGFLTGLYVLFVPVICRLIYRQTLSGYVFPAAALSVAGVYLLSGGGPMSFSSGDGLVLLCAVGFAIQVALIGKIMAAVKAPFRICFLQYAVTAFVAFIGAMIYEHPNMDDILKAWIPILYGGAISGGIAYTLQVVAQQYTPASDSAVILSGESVFAAITAAIMNGERLSPAGTGGCLLIILAILMVEFGPYLAPKKQS